MKLDEKNDLYLELCLHWNMHVPCLPHKFTLIECASVHAEGTEWFCTYHKGQ